ncbi:MAG: nucleoside/nucleotide kinase family protein [Candidatus Nanopelagicaceae bacterium]|nr:nucleoside/nucleotide kinase family protein [Candidatus Nanopelagicaceae bacterium]
MPIVINTAEEALKRVRDLQAKESERIIIGVVGKPGAGKSTLTSYLLDNLVKDKAVLVPMDGYHLSNKLLAEHGSSDRKGAYDTFDATGFSELMKRIKFDLKSDIYFPIFHREVEESIVAEGVVLKDTKLVITEGNYLLLDKYGWQDISSFITESWYIEINDNLRWERLMARSIRYGRSPESAHAWTHGSDEVNAKVVESTKNRADVILNLS